jgi:hypothetical protein
MPSRDAHSTARPAPAPKAPRGPRIPAATRVAASAEVDAALLALRRASTDEAARHRRGGDDDAQRREQGYRTAIDECRKELRKRKALDHLRTIGELALGAGPGFREGVEDAYARAQALYDAAIVAHAAVKDEVAPNGDEEPGGA